MIRLLEYRNPWCSTSSPLQPSGVTLDSSVSAAIPPDATRLTPRPKRFWQRRRMVTGSPICRKSPSYWVTGIEILGNSQEPSTPSLTGGDCRWRRGVSMLTMPWNSGEDTTTDSVGIRWEKHPLLKNTKMEKPSSLDMYICRLVYVWNLD